MAITLTFRRWDPCVAGTLASLGPFRRWRKPQAMPGGRYRTGAGLLEVTSVNVVTLEAITPGRGRGGQYSNADVKRRLRLAPGRACQGV